jgi:pyruvate/2-oxoglutarate dehydrogenase complex dihydrolipoamide dehydrogenase (E3) component
MISTETANHLAHHGKDVTIVEMLPQITQDVTATVRELLFRDLVAKNVRIYVDAKVKDLQPNGLIVKKNGREENIGTYNTVVPAMGLEPCHS